MKSPAKYPRRFSECGRMKRKLKLHAIPFPLPPRKIMPLRTVLNRESMEMKGARRGKKNPLSFATGLGNQENVTPPPSDGQEIRRRGVEIAERLKGYFENGEFASPRGQGSVQREMQNLIRLLTEISSQKPRHRPWG